MGLGLKTASDFHLGVAYMALVLQMRWSIIINQQASIMGAWQLSWAKLEG